MNYLKLALGHQWTIVQKIGAKIRLAQLDKVPYMLIIGANEIETNTISVRHRSRGDIGSIVPKNLSLNSKKK